MTESVSLLLLLRNSSISFQTLFFFCPFFSPELLLRIASNENDKTDVKNLATCAYRMTYRPAAKSVWQQSSSSWPAVFPTPQSRKQTHYRLAGVRPFRRLTGEKEISLEIRFRLSPCSRHCSCVNQFRIRLPFSELRRSNRSPHPLAACPTKFKS